MLITQLTPRLLKIERDRPSKMIPNKNKATSHYQNLKGE